MGNGASASRPKSKTADLETHFRVANLDDAGALAALQVKAWKDTYRGIINDEFLESKSMSECHKERKWVKILQDRSCLTLILSKKNCKEMLGYTTVAIAGGRSREKIERTLKEDIGLKKKFGTKVHGEMRTLYLSTDAPKRKGLGSKLFEHGYSFLERHLGEGCVMCLWVIAENTPAMKFYEKLGCKIAVSNSRARFGKGLYRYVGLVYSKYQPVAELQNEAKENGKDSAQ